MQISSVIKIDLAAFTHRDKLELAADLIHNLFIERQVNNGGKCLMQSTMSLTKILFNIPLPSSSQEVFHSIL